MRHCRVANSGIGRKLLGGNPPNRFQLHLKKTALQLVPVLLFVCTWVAGPHMWPQPCWPSSREPEPLTCSCSRKKERVQVGCGLNAETLSWLISRNYSSWRRRRKWWWWGGGDGGTPHKLGHAGPCQLHPRSAHVEALPGLCLQNPLETTSLSFIIAVSESCSGFRSSSYDRGPGRRRSQGVFWVSGRCFRKTAALEARIRWWWVSGTSVNSPEPRRSHAEVSSGWGKWRMSNNFVNYLELPRRENPFCSKPASFQLPLRACITHSIFFGKNIILFLYFYFWLCRVFVAARATRCRDLSRCRVQSLGSGASVAGDVGSVVAA